MVDPLYRNAGVILDVTDPEHPVQTGIYENVAIDRLGYNDVFIKNKHIYFASKTYGVWIIDISDPGQPKDLGRLEAPSSGIRVSGENAYTIHDNTIRIIDVSDPAIPHQTGSYLVPITVKWFDLSGSKLCVYSSNEFRIIDVTDANNPFEAASVIVGSKVVKIDIAGNEVYCWTKQTEGLLKIYGIGESINPRDVGSYNIPENLIHLDRKLI